MTMIANHIHHVQLIYDHYDWSQSSHGTSASPVQWFVHQRQRMPDCAAAQPVGHAGGAWVGWRQLMSSQDNGATIQPYYYNRLRGRWLKSAVLLASIDLYCTMPLQRLPINIWYLHSKFSSPLILAQVLCCQEGGGDQKAWKCVTC